MFCIARQSFCSSAMVVSQSDCLMLMPAYRSPDGTILFVTETSGRIITYKPYELNTVNSNNQKQFLGGWRAASPLH